MSLSPEQVVEALRALKAQIPSVVPMTPAQRRVISEQTRRIPNDVVQSSINLIDMSDTIAQAVGMPAADVREMVDEANRWMAVEGERRAALNGVAGANLIRRQRIAQITRQAYNFARHLVGLPGHNSLIPLVEHVNHLRKLASRRRRAKETPEPVPIAEGEVSTE